MKLTHNEHKLIDALARETRETVKVLEHSDKEYCFILGFYGICGLDFLIQAWNGTITHVYEIRFLRARDLSKIEKIFDLIGTAQEGDF